MYKRFLSSLLKPREIIVFLKDSWLKVWAYLLILAVLLTVPFFAAELTYKGFSSHEITQISNAFRLNLSGPYEIVDAKLIIPATNMKDIRYVNVTNYSINLLNAPVSPDKLARINFKQDGIEIVFLEVFINFQTYESIGLSNFDFSDYSPENVTKFTNAMQNYIGNYNVETKAIYLGYVLIANIIDILLITTLVAVVIKSRLGFKLRFKIGIYNATIYTVLVFYANIFSLGFLTYVAMFLFLRNQWKSVSSIIMR